MSERRNELAPLIRTKLQPPLISGDWVARPRLLRHLDCGLGQKLTLVSAPAGYGKTTLICAWLDTKQTACAWLTLDPSDNDLITFLSYFIAAVHTVAPNACAETQSLLYAPQRPPSDYLRDSLISELAALAEPVCLILDDYHVIQQNDIQRILLALVQHQLPHLHLVIATRHDPPFSLARFRGAQRLVELRTKDLRFSYEEGQTFLEQQLGKRLDPGIVEKLVDRTEGWAVGLRMAALTMQDQDDYPAFVASFQGSHRLVTTYLLDEVFARESQVVRTFLLRTSILKRLSATLCDAVVRVETGGGTQAEKPENGAAAAPPSLEILERLEKSNLFVTPLDPQGEWFRYHQLFQELLTHRLRSETTETERAKLHVAASAWLEQNGFVEDALRQRMAAGDYSGAARLVGRHRYALMNETQWQRIEQWLRLFPPDMVDSYADLLMLKAWILYHHGHYGEVPAALERVENALDRASLNPESAGHLQGELCALQSLMHYYAIDLVRASACAKQSIEQTAPDLWIVRILARLILAVAQQMTGRLVDAYGTMLTGFDNERVINCRFKTILLSTVCHVSWIAADLQGLVQYAEKSLAVSQDEQMPEFVGWGHYHLGCAYYHQNDLAAAEQHFGTVVRNPYLSYGLCYLQSACGLALTYQAQERPDDARSVAASAVGFLLETGNTTLLPVVQSFQLELALRQGQAATPTLSANPADSVPDLLPLVEFYEPVLTLVKSWLAEDTPASRERAAHCLDQLLTFTKETHNTRYLIEVLALHAMLHMTYNRISEARSALAQAIQLAEPGGFLRLFADLGARMADLLADLRTSDDRHNAYIARIQSAFAQHNDTRHQLPTARAGQSSLIEPLSNREMDVLVFLAARHTDKEIAAQLVISPNTVSTHTRHIFAKLEVHNRRDAVARAQALGLLPSE